MNEAPILSIIVPVYNSELYLHRCIDSILNQTFTDFEVICVVKNDIKADRSLEILQEYKEKDARIIIINQENKGVAAARNTGLKYMRGTYLGFVDADDFIEPEMYNYMIQKLIENNVDSVVCGFKILGNNGLEGSSKQLEDKFIKNTFDRFNAHTSDKFDINYKNIGLVPVLIWSHLLKTEIIRKYDIKFPEGLLHEDNAFTWFYMLLSHNTIFLNKEHERFYNYFKHESSNSIHALQYPLVIDLFTNVENILKHLKKHNILDKFLPVILLFLVDSYNIVIDRIPENRKYLLSYRLHCALQDIDLNKVIEMNSKDNITIFTQEDFHTLMNIKNRVIYTLNITDEIFFSINNEHSFF